MPKKSIKTRLAELDKLGLEDSEKKLAEDPELREAAYVRDMERMEAKRRETHGAYGQ